MSGLYVYQIGDMPLKMPRRLLKPSYSMKGDMDVTIPPLSHKPLVGSQRHSFIEREVELPFFTVRENSKYGANETANALAGYEKYPVPVIGFFLENDDVWDNKHCVCCNTDDVIWLETIAFVSSVDNENDDPFLPGAITLQLKLIDYWRCLDELSWSFTYPSKSNLTVNELPTNYRNNFNQLPRLTDIFDETCVKQFVYKNFDDTNYIYDVDYWGDLFCHNNCLDSCGASYQWSQVGQWFDIDLNKHFFNGPPLSMYALRGLPTTGSVVITTVVDAVHKSETRDVTIDCELLNETIDNAGYTGLTRSDVIVFGDLHRYHNGRLYPTTYIVRDGSILDGVYPEINYTTYFPGMLNSGESRILVDAPQEVDIAMVHYGRKL